MDLGDSLWEFERPVGIYHPIWTWLFCEVDFQKDDIYRQVVLRICVLIEVFLVESRVGWCSSKVEFPIRLWHSLDLLWFPVVRQCIQGVSQRSAQIHTSWDLIWLRTSKCSKTTDKMSKYVSLVIDFPKRSST